MGLEETRFVTMEDIILIATAELLKITEEVFRRCI
jgi:hypothetical protein